MILRAVIQNTYREALRDRVLYVLIFFAIVAIGASKAIGWLSIGQDIKIVRDISLSAMSLFGVLISIFVGTNLVFKEVERRTIYTILARPISREVFILGKYFGLMSILFVTIVLMTLGLSLYLLILGDVPDIPLFVSIMMIYVELGVITAIALLLSSLTSPILGAIIVFFIYFLGHGTGILEDLPDPVNTPVVAFLMKFIFYVFPNLETFNLRGYAAYGIPVPPGKIFLGLVYGTAYSTAMIFLAALAFRRKDL